MDSPFVTRRPMTFLGTQMYALRVLPQQSDLITGALHHPMPLLHLNYLQYSVSLSQATILLLINLPPPPPPPPALSSLKI